MFEIYNAPQCLDPKILMCLLHRNDGGVTPSDDPVSLFHTQIQGEISTKIHSL